jgi:uncharacterized lipoprotein YddW (UPF0748 family)
MASTQPLFPDIQTHWARSFIEALVQRNIIRGFPDGTFRPSQSLTRAQFAVLIDVALSPTAKRPYTPFVDVPANHWAANAIRKAYEAGFLSGYPGQQFRPDEAIQRGHALVALVGGLGLSAPIPVPLTDVYQDAAQIPGWATGAIATATVLQLVINYPNLRQLRPTQAASRAEVAATIYQCLVQQGQAPAIATDQIVTLAIPVSHTREFRAVWITSVWNKDFPTQASASSLQQQAELMALLDRIQALNFNAVVFQVRPEGDALYASQLEPWSNWLTGTQGKAPNPAWDPLEFAIAQCHRRNLELHAWFNPYRARTSRNTVNVRPHIAVTNPEVVYDWGTQRWMDPGAKVVEDRTYAVIMDVLRRYDVDGIHLDDYFYPYPIAGQTFPDQKTYQAYRNSGGTLSLADWRRENVNRLIQRLTQGIRTTKPHVKFGISPFGIYRPGQPPQIQGLDAYEALYADSLKWLQQGWVDYLAPQLYWRIDPPAQSYTALLNWWAASNSKQRHLYIGNNIAQLDGKAWELEEIERQIALTRQANSKLALGNIMFSLDAITSNRQGLSDRLRSKTYQPPALAPVIPWLQAPIPPQPSLRRNGNTLIWQAATSVRSWTLYRRSNNGWSLQRILPASLTSITVEPGTYALCSVNRLGRESLGTPISVG